MHTSRVVENTKFDVDELWTLSDDGLTLTVEGAVISSLGGRGPVCCIAQGSSMSSESTEGTMRSVIQRLSVCLVTVMAASALLGQDAKLSLENKERFLLTGKVISQKHLSEGITGALRVTLTDERLTHDAQVQHIDEYKQVFTSALGTELNFRDTYKFNRVWLLWNDGPGGRI